MDHTYREYKIIVIIVEECASFFPIPPSAPFSFLLYAGNMHMLEMVRKQMFPYDFWVSHLLLLTLSRVLFHIIQTFFLFFLDMIKIFFTFFSIFIWRCFQLFFPCGVSLLCRNWEKGRAMSKWDYLSGNFLEFLGLFETTVLKCGKMHSA